MHFFLRYSFILCVLLHSNQRAFSQCGVFLDTTTFTHTTCSTSSDGSASLLSSSTFLNYSWNNITNGQNYGSGVNAKANVFSWIIILTDEMGAIRKKVGEVTLIR